ncbi:MAG: peptidoglycan DD-metalloendopeptidase family protein [Minisyncoccota bacterium]
MPIKFNHQFLIAGFAVAAVLIIITGTTTILPNRANAFWPFSNANAAVADTNIPSSTTPALVAVINNNPNIGAPLALATSDGSALVPYTGISGTIADISSTTPSDRISLYVVRPGDTLSEIADMFGVSVNTIIWANNLSSANDVHPGDTLLILPISGVKYTVAKNDTLKSIAKKYGADANEIAQFNGLDSSSALEVGSTIIIPGGEVAPPRAATSASGRGSRRVGREPYLGGSGPAQNGYYSNPLPGGIITQGIHGWDAVDIGAARGTPIYAAANGIVIVSRNGGSWNGGYGNYVVITHDNGTQTLYAHMKATVVSVGESVSSGQVIGYVGMTGLTTGPHLHFEVRGAANPFRNCAVGSVCEPQ